MPDARCRIRAIRWKNGGQLRVLHRGPSEPSPTVIAEIENMLAQARSGELQAFAYAKVMANGVPRYGWRHSERDQRDSDRLAAAISVLFLDYGGELVDLVRAAQKEGI